MKGGGLQMADGIIVRICEVLSVQDNQAGLRIKVRLEPYDNNYKNIEDIPYCFPLLPKFFHCNPKVGECVAVILSTMGATQGQRWYIGPLISQPQKLGFDPFNYQARSLFSGAQTARPFPNPKTDPENNGSLPDQEDIAIQGRGNTDILLKDSDVVVRCGFKKAPHANPKDNLRFNREDLAYMLTRYKKSVGPDGRPYSSSINLVADRINLLSHDSKDVFNLNDQKSLITDEDMQDILVRAHQLPYGDELVSFLQKFIEVFRTHTHPFSMDPPCLTTPQQDVLSMDLTSMLSKSIRIN